MTHWRLLYVLLFLGLAAPAAGQEWTFRTPMDTPRTGVATAVLDGNVYVLGGEDQFGVVLDVASRYHPATDTWEALPPMQVARVFAAAVAIDGVIVVVGGRDAQENVLSDAEFYDPVRNQWGVFPNMLEARQGLAAVLRNANLFVAGGSNAQDQLLDSIEFYESPPSGGPPGGAWTAFEESDGEDVEVTGLITALDASSITVNAFTFVLTDTTEVVDENDLPITRDVLRVGMTVEVYGIVTEDDVLVATRIEIEDRGEVEITGVITGITLSSITVDGTTFSVNAATEILDATEMPITLADLAVGMTVEVHGIREANGTLVATRIEVEGQGQLAFCTSGIDLNVGDTFNIRDYVEVEGGAQPVDWTQAFFTYTEAGADDPTTPPDWNLAAFNAGQPVTIVAADASGGNQDTGRYRIYVVRQGQAMYDDYLTFRIDNDRESQVEEAKCVNQSAVSKRTGASQLGTPRAGLAAVSVGDRVLFMGGFGQLGPLDLVQQLGTNDRFQTLTPLPSARGGLSAAALNDTVVVIGGRDGSNRVLADILYLDPATNQWGQMPRLLTERENSGAAVVEGVLYVFGGRDGSGRVLGSVEALGEETVPTSVEDEALDGLDFKLDQNYPNPFQANTTIRFMVSTAQSGRSVSLAVYDLQGRRVAELVNGVLAPGPHTLTWDGRGVDGRPVGSGVYFYRLQQGSLTARKMMAVVH